MNNNLDDNEMVTPPSSSSSSSPSTNKTKVVVPLSSSNSTASNSTTAAVAATAGMNIRSVKKEEDEFTENHHDDNDDDRRSRRVQVLQVKKDGNPDKETKSKCDDNDYSDWKAGNWCWVLPANKDNKNISNETQQQLEGQNNKTPNRRRCVKTESDDYGNINSDEGDEEHDGDKAHSSAPPKKKMRRCQKLKSDTNIASSIKQEECSIDNDDSVVASSVNNNNNDDDDDDDDDDGEDNNAMEQGSTDNNEHANEECDDGYESWTEGNWCWILPLPNCDEARKFKHQPSSEVVPVTTEVNNATLSRSSRRRRSSNELNKSTKKGKGTTTYAESRNKKWHEMFRRLVAYRKKHKSILVPIRYAADLKLGKWVSTQRSNHRNDMIAEERLDFLNSVGFVWEMHEQLPWDEMFQKLVRYKEEHRTTIVPQEKNTADPRLGNWVYLQRMYYKNKELSVERINRLDSIAFVWDPFEKHWMEMYNRLVAYKKQYRSTKVPRSYMEDPQLGIWVSNQRRVYNNTKAGNLSEKRLGLLNSINFVWSAR